MDENNTKNVFPIVGIGCSAGGLEVLETFFSSIPNKPGMAFIIIMHLDPTRETGLDEILKKFTSLTVKLIENREEIKKNIVYILPPNNEVRLENNKFHLKTPEQPRGRRLPIDIFFRSLANELEDKAIGVLFSGTGTDGTLGLKYIKGHGGLAIVQDPKEAEYSGMLESAINNVQIDLILPLLKIPEYIINYVKDYVKPSSRQLEIPSQIKSGDEDLQPIHDFLKKNSRREILAYKQTTLNRRILKRMAVNRLSSFKEYATFLSENPSEIDTLFQEILINVTDFFRDKEAFEKLGEKIIPKILEHKSEEDHVRIWVVGCSTGEEAYSIAIILKDYLEKNKIYNKVMLFASDANPKAITKAREGNYTENISLNVPENYLRKYFTREDNHYKIKSEIRKMIIFAVHNIIEDPPFSNMDLISCRNLLIYMRSDLQKNLLQVFHYSLKDHGYLFLGSSESVGVFSSLFSEVDRKARLFKRKQYAEHISGYNHPLPPFIDHKIRGDHLESIKKKGSEKINYKELMDQLLLENYSPSSVIINEKNEILYIHGRTGKYLEPPVGKAELDILKMAREGLHIVLNSAISKAKSEKTKITYENIRVKINGENTLVNLIIHPITEPEYMEGLFLILFQESAMNLSRLEKEELDVSANGLAQVRIEQLEKELHSTRNQLTSTIEQLETTNEELRTTNEEFQSSNEELKSTNEELQTSKEELQSVNEELLTVNNELETKIEELTTANNDLRNLIESTEMATIFLDSDLMIKRFTPPARKIFNLVNHDIGRDFRDLSSRLNYDNLEDDVLKVQEDLQTIEKDVQTKSNKWYTMRVLPYRTEDNRIMGTVITFFDITEKKKAEQLLIKSEQKYKEAYEQIEFYQDLITHDFNNLLQGLILSTELLKEQVQGKTKEIVIGMEDQLNKRIQLIENIHKLSLIDEEVSEKTTYNLIEFINRQIIETKKAHPKEKIKFHFDHPGDAVEIIASKFLNEAFRNILDNAVKYDENELKEITIRVGKYKNDQNDYYKIAVEDKGMGMSNNLKQQIMGENTIKRKNIRSGMGIGLSIVKKVMKTSGGEIWIENRVEADSSKGTRIILLLPKYSGTN